jgi:flavorubredoxin
MKVSIDEIAPDVHRLSVFIPDLNMQFNHFLVRDEEPLLFHTGLRATFPALREAIGRIMDPAKLRWIGWSHFESDECGALNDWLQVAPQAQPVCTLVGKLVTVDDYSLRPAFGMTPNDLLRTGKYQYRFHASPHIPHGWDAGVLFEETNKTLFCSDLFHHFGDVAPVTNEDIIGQTSAALEQLATGPLAGYMPYTRRTEKVLGELAKLGPSTMAVMHGSSYNGNCGKALIDLAGEIKKSFEADL